MPRSPVRTLVVDDADAFRRAAAVVIGVTEGFVLVGEATSGENAIALLGDVEADLVLMDVNMPGCGGVEAAVRLRRDHRGLCVVLLTAHDMPRVGYCGPASAFPCRPKDAFGPEELARLWRDWTRGTAR